MTRHKHELNTNVLLREGKRLTARRVACTRCAAVFPGVGGGRVRRPADGGQNENITFRRTTYAGGNNPEFEHLHNTKSVSLWANL